MTIDEFKISVSHRMDEENNVFKAIECAVKSAGMFYKTINIERIFHGNIVGYFSRIPKDYYITKIEVFYTNKESVSVRISPSFFP